MFQLHISRLPVLHFYSKGKGSQARVWYNVPVVLYRVSRKRLDLVCFSKLPTEGPPSYLFMACHIHEETRS